MAESVRGAVAADSQDIIIGHTLDLAKEIHQEYNRNRLREFPDRPLEYPTWECLPADMRYSNIRQAQKIPEKLSAIGCYISAEGDDPVLEFTEDEVETMAILEHEHWVDERESNGWAYGPVKDVENRLSPYIAPWEQLPEFIKEYDREPSRNIIPLLEKIGLHVFRSPTKDVRIEGFRYDRRSGIPLILSVTGHINIDPGSMDLFEKKFEGFIADMRKRFGSTRIILMTALAEGVDRISARIAMRNGVNIAPVFPKRAQDYRRTFTGTGYVSTEESQRDFDDILADEMTYTPCILNLSDVNEVQAFRELSAYLIANSHILVAAWDGVRSEYRGGTYDTLRMAFRGIDTDLLEKTSPKLPVSEDRSSSNAHYLNADEDSLIYWVKVGRAGGVQANIPLESCIPDGTDAEGAHFIIHTGPDDAGSRIEVCKGIFGRLTEELPQQYSDAFGRLDEVNALIHQELGDAPSDHDHDQYMKDGYGLLINDSEEVRQAGCMSDMAGRFSVIEKLAQQYHKKSRKANFLLSSLTIVYTALFSLLILLSSSTLVTIAYAAVFMVTLLLSRRHMKTHEHELYVGLRSLAESIRVEFYWGLLGINDTVSKNSYGFTKNGLSWMRAVMKGCSSYFTNDYSVCNSVPLTVRMDCTCKCWVSKQMEYCENMAEGQLQKFRRYMREDARASKVIGALSILTAIIAVFFMSDVSETIFEFKDIINGSMIKISSYTLLKLVMIALLAASSILTLLMSQLDYTSKGQIEAQAMLFSTAEDKLSMEQWTSPRKINARKRRIMHELGIAVLRENDDWAHESSKKDFKKKKGLFNATNKSKDKGGEDQNPLMEIFDFS